MNTLVARRQRELLGLASAYWPLFMAAVAGLYLISLYESQALAAVVSRAGLNGGLLHELFHDVRHAAGFMCH